LTAPGEQSGSRATETRQRIVEAALAEFALRGLDGARVDRIAKAAHVNKAMIYYHFSSKRDLYYHVVTDLMALAMDDVREAIVETDTLEENLERLADIYSRMFFRYPAFPLLLARELATSDSEILPEMARILKESGNPAQIGALFASGMADGSLRSQDVRQSVVSFIVLNVGYYLLSPLFNRILEIEDTDAEVFVRERKKAVVKLFLNGARAR
jgi:TetR/AcrR family transcriptional regulator